MIIATHPFRRRQLNVLDENGNEGCAFCGRRRGAHRAEPVDADLLDLAHVRLRDLLDGGSGGNSSVLDDLMKRLFDPDEQEHRTISAFSSGL